MKKLSIIIPVFNEEKTLKKTLSRILKLNHSKIKKEIIVVNDGSTDKTNLILSKISKSIIKIRHTKNKGKGEAVRSGIKKASGDYILIQDADLEYNPNQIPTLIKKALDHKNKEIVVYGTRLKRLPSIKNDEIFYFTHYFGNRFLSLLVSVLYKTWLTDIETCYKLIPKTAFRKFKLNSKGFEFEPEVTIKLLK